MNGINRRGQKVVCVAEIELVLLSGRTYPGPMPQVDETYTVVDFAHSGCVRGIGIEAEALAPGIVLREIPSPRSTADHRLFGFPIIAFRPLDERETDIGDLLKLQAPTKQTEPA